MKCRRKNGLAYFESKGHPAVAINSLEGKGLQTVFKAAKELLKPKWDRMKERGIKPRAIRAMIVGIPNVGKSTLINRFAKKNIARTGNTPGVPKNNNGLKSKRKLNYSIHLVFFGRSLKINKLDISWRLLVR